MRNADRVCVYTIQACCHSRKQNKLNPDHLCHLNKTVQGSQHMQKIDVDLSETKMLSTFPVRSVPYTLTTQIVPQNEETKGILFYIRLLIVDRVLDKND